MKKQNEKIKTKSKSQTKYKLPLQNYINIPKNKNNNINTIKKYDIHKLNSLLDDLAKKDLEYDLIIQGYKEKINTKKRENNFLQKEIETMSKENSDMTNQNKKIRKEKDYKAKEKKIEIKYKNNMTNLNMINIKDKYNQEISKNKEIMENIIKTKKEINLYKNKLNELDEILNNNNRVIEKEEEEMKKFLSEL